jgi:hypothetical protein
MLHALFLVAVAQYLFRFHSVLYNAHALQAEENQSRSGPSESEGVFFLRPMRYDEEVPFSHKDGIYALKSMYRP